MWPGFVMTGSHDRPTAFRCGARIPLRACTRRRFSTARPVDPFMPMVRALALVVSLHWAGAARAACADVSFVLAIDATGSVMPDEFALQQEGSARAFRSARTHAALAVAGEVIVGVILWGDSEFEHQTLPMTRIAGVRMRAGWPTGSGRCRGGCRAIPG